MSKPNDVINRPTHYTQGGIEPLEYIIENKLNFLEGNIVKYVSRYKFKNGVEDLRKAAFYLDRLIKLYIDKGEQHESIGSKVSSPSGEVDSKGNGPVW